MIIEIPDSVADITASFTTDELKRIGQILSDPVFVKLEAKAEAFKPSANCALAGSTGRDAFSNDRATARLGEIRGWEMRRGAIFAALQPVKEKSKQTPENFQPVLSPEPTSV